MPEINISRVSRTLQTAIEYAARTRDLGDDLIPFAMVFQDGAAVDIMMLLVDDLASAMQSLARDLPRKHPQWTDLALIMDGSHNPDGEDEEQEGIFCVIGYAGGSGFMRYFQPLDAEGKVNTDPLRVMSVDQLPNLATIAEMAGGEPGSEGEPSTLVMDLGAFERVYQRTLRYYQDQADAGTKVGPFGLVWSGSGITKLQMPHFPNQQAHLDALRDQLDQQIPNWTDFSLAAFAGDQSTPPRPGLMIITCGRTDPVIQVNFQPLLDSGKIDTRPQSTMSIASLPTRAR